MPVLDPSLTLAELVTVRPEWAVVLDQLGLDYCCGGQRPLADAAADQGLALPEVVAALETHRDDGGSTETWTGLDLAELADHIETTHHTYLHERLPRLDALSAKVAGVHGDRHPELHEVRRLVVELRADLEPHLGNEEQVLFPMIRQLARATTTPRFHCGSIRNPITVMMTEHDHAGELLAALRSVTAGYAVPDDGCASYRALYAELSEVEADTHLHVHKENNVLFPAVLAAEAALPAG